jgi:hypothetical protein
MGQGILQVSRERGERREGRRGNERERESSRVY